MTSETGRKTAQAHWDTAWQLPVRPRMPSRLNVSVRDTTKLIASKVRPGDRYLEVGCAPGKILAWVQAKLGARAEGLDYSDVGIRNCRGLFDALRLPVELHQADFFSNTIEKRSFDVVTSFGFIEHFDDPREAVAKHLELLRPGGTALIVVPNYQSLYGFWQQRCDSENLALHNLNIMSTHALKKLVDPAQALSISAYTFGSFSLSLVSIQRCLPSALASLILLTANLMGLLQPFHVRRLAPMLVLEVTAR